MESAHQRGQDVYGHGARGRPGHGPFECLPGVPEAAKTIENDRLLGQSLGVQSTPTYFINNKMVVGVKSLKDELDAFFPKR